MTKKEKEQLAIIAGVVHYLVESGNNQNVYAIDKYGGLTEDAFRHGNWMMHLDKILLESIEQGILKYEDPI